MNRSRRTLLLAGGLALAPRFSRAAAPKPLGRGWRSLFNGKDLSAWDTWLGIPHKSVEGLDHSTPVGLNKDPKNVYRVGAVDGAPAILISGEVFGAITSKEDFADYHVRLEYKWGEKKWPPKDKAVRDSGLLYHCVGEHGADGSGKYWMRSLECQIQEHDTGDFWGVANVVVDVAAERIEGGVRYKKRGEKLTLPGPGLPRRIIKSLENEKPNDWNLVEVLCLGGTSVHVVNGKVNMVLENARQPGETPDAPLRPLTRGKLQIQSEGAEIYYRNIAVRPIKALPAAYRP